MDRNYKKARAVLIIGQPWIGGTCSPWVTKLAHAWCLRGIDMSARGPRYLPSESYLGQNEDYEIDRSSSGGTLERMFEVRAQQKKCSKVDPKMR